MSGASTAATDGAGAELAYQSALAALDAKAWAEAELQFERVLMLNPEHAEARIQLALLLAQRGKLETASGFLQSLIDDPRTPLEHRQRLVDLLAQLKPAALTISTAPQPPANVSGQAPAIVQARLSLGYTSNPYARADINSLTLTLPSGNADLTVTPNISPAPMLTSSLSYMAPNLCGFEAYDQRWSTTERYATSKLTLFCHNDLAGQKIQTFASYLKTLEGSRRVSAGLMWPMGGWRLTGQVFREPQFGELGYSFRADHLQANSMGEHTLIYAEAEKTTAALGGNVRTGFLKQVFLAPTLSLLMQMSVQRDFVGYSDLLENGARRHLLYAELGLQKDWGKYGGWNLGSTLYARRRWSNLALFGFSEAAIQISIDKLL
jgi:tetratricopeptide (TPR) repeat protein